MSELKSCEKACPRFIQFLKETIQVPHEIAQVQEFMGYCLLGENRFPKAVFMLGIGIDGKSTLAAVIRGMLGADHCSNYAISDLENEFVRGELSKKKAIFISESNGFATGGSFFKSILAGDPVNASFKLHPQFVFRPSCKFIFASNAFPAYEPGINRRLLVITFKRQFVGGDCDPYLREKLMNELPGITAWAKIGLDRLIQNEKFTEEISPK